MVHPYAAIKWGPPYPRNYQGIIYALIDKFGLKEPVDVVYGPPYQDSYKGVIECIQDLLGGGGSDLSTYGFLKSWVIATVDTAMTKGTGYFANGGSRLFLTLPTTASSTTGDTVAVYDLSGNGWRVVQNSDQQIRFGNVLSTAGSTGYIESTEVGNTVHLVYSQSGLWTVSPGSQGNITINTTPATTDSILPVLITGVAL